MEIVVSLWQACYVLNSFNSLKFKKKGVLEKAVTLLQHAMITDKDLPVKVEAAIAIQMLLSEQERGACVLVIISQFLRSASRSCEAFFV